MTNEEKKFLEPLLRNFMEKRKANVTDADVAKAMELFGAMADGAESIYHYEHPDYGAMVKEVPDTLGQLLDNSEEHSDVILFDDMMDACSKMERSALVDAVDSLIYYYHLITLKPHHQKTSKPLSALISKRVSSGYGKTL
jgi:hypothetical protein